MIRHKIKRTVQGRLVSLLWKVQALQNIEHGEFYLPANLDIWERQLKNCISLNEEKTRKQS